MRTIVKPLALVTVVMAVSACSSIQLKPGADNVEVLKAERVADCRKLGRTTVSVADSIGFIPRGEKAIREDLHRLARNSAVTMDGDTVSAESPIENGEQTFGVYNCI